MEIIVLMQRVLMAPSPANLLALQAALLALEEVEGWDHTAAALAVLADFYAYLLDVESKLSAHEFAEFASRLDLGAVGGVAFENILASGERLIERILLGGLSETLMVLASRQYVKAFTHELDTVHRQTAWQVRAHLWRLSAARRPDVPLGQRTALVDKLLAPIFSDEASTEAKTVLLGWLFQILLLGYVSALPVDRG